MTEASEIPDDVMKRARRLIYETIGAVDFPNGKFLIEGYYDDSLIEAIASALMEERKAERKRCAAIAEARRSVPSQDIDQYGTTLAKDIATAIRNTDAPDT